MRTLTAELSGLPRAAVGLLRSSSFGTISDSSGSRVDKEALSAETGAMLVSRCGCLVVEERKKKAAATAL